ncbi:MAG: tautomerase family protein [Betaproteobacteria bacterium]|nr:tautomerase family protein [Betaproteobacteria bacterium]
MPHIQVTLVRGRTKEQKRWIAECLTAVLARSAPGACEYSHRSGGAMGYGHVRTPPCEAETGSSNGPSVSLRGAQAASTSHCRTPDTPTSQARSTPRNRDRVRPGEATDADGARLSQRC